MLRAMPNYLHHLNNRLYSLLFACILGFSLLSCTKKDPDDPIIVPDETEFPTYIKACDLSFLPEMRSDGVGFKNFDQQAEDPLTTLTKAGMNMVRLRVWNNPEGKSSPKDVAIFSKEIEEKKIVIWLTLHYSDTWADPGAQSKPAAWTNLDFETLKDSVYHFTYAVAAAMKPGILQIGNEINAGLLWPEGHRSNIFQMRALLSEGIRACREASPKTKIMLHYAGHQNATSFFEPFNNLDFDYIGLSFYPIWHGKSLDELKTSIQNLKNTYNKEVVIAETSYPFSFGWADWTNNVLGNSGQIISNFPASPQGQIDFLWALDATVSEAGGKGWAYWGAEWVASKGDQASNGSSWENQALWDFEFKVLPAVNTFVRPVGK